MDMCYPFLDISITICAIHDVQLSNANDIKKKKESEKEAMGGGKGREGGGEGERVEGK
jgi:hypothetical protein